jgi:hypothetical protein
MYLFIAELSEILHSVPNLSIPSKFVCDCVNQASEKSVFFSTGYVKREFRKRRGTAPVGASYPFMG